MNPNATRASLSLLLFTAATAQQQAAPTPPPAAAVRLPDLTAAEAAARQKFTTAGEWDLVKGERTIVAFQWISKGKGPRRAAAEAAARKGAERLDAYLATIDAMAPPRADEVIPVPILQLYATDDQLGARLGRSEGKPDWEVAFQAFKQGDFYASLESPERSDARWRIGCWYLRSFAPDLPFENCFVNLATYVLLMNDLHTPQQYAKMSKPTDESAFQSLQRKWDENKAAEFMLKISGDTIMEGDAWLAIVPWADFLTRGASQKPDGWNADWTKIVPTYIATLRASRSSAKAAAAALQGVDRKAIAAALWTWVATAKVPPRMKRPKK